MDKNNDGQMPATDDQELAQVLAGMNQQVADPAQVTDNGMQFEETGVEPTADPALTDSTTAPSGDPATATAPAIPPEPAPVPPPAIAEPVFQPAAEPAPLAAPSSVSPELEAIKKDALEQLRPLVDKLDLPAQEKFDTLLLIIRSTDDQSLLTAANEAAKQIDDESKRAEALLDVIKEIDFFSGHTQAQ